MFYKDLFDKLDIDVQIIRHGKFKSAVEPFMLNKMSVENREQIKLLLNSFLIIYYRCTKEIFHYKLSNSDNLSETQQRLSQT